MMPRTHRKGRAVGPSIGDPARVQGLMDDEISEERFQRRVLGLARFYGWLGYHTHDSRRSAPGFPDLTLTRHDDVPELIIAELKTEKGRVRPEQRTWLDQLQQVAIASQGAVEVHLWRPSDLDLIHDRLARGRVRTDPEWAIARGNAL